MMGNNGIHKIAGAYHTRIQPSLCGQCVFLKLVDDTYWPERCAAKGKKLSNPHVIKGKCAQFQQSETPTASPEMIAGWIEEAEGYIADKKRRQKR